MLGLELLKQKKALSSVTTSISEIAQSELLTLEIGLELAEPA